MSGKNDVLALMFDMNKLWEKFVFKSLKKFKNQDTIINEQVTKYFWKPKNGFRSPIIPDIIMKNIKQDISIVLDTKWKNLNGKNPSPDDLKQMYVYHNYYEANQVLLIYPGIESFNTGFYLHPKTGSATETECSVICLSVINSNIYEWQKYIHDFIYKNLNLLSANTLSLV